MSDNDEKKRLTLEDPVDEATLVALARLRDVRMGIGSQLIDLELQKVQLLGSVRRIDEQNQRMFDAILVDRGLAPGTTIELDGKTGRIKVLREDSHVPAQAEPQGTTSAG